MAMSKCMRCDGTTFELKENTPRTSNFKLMFVQCSSCGGVVGVQEYFNLGYYVKQIAEKLGIK